ncbi:MAG: HD domain-containing protein, partial [Gammaproteobacteria bacterium]
MLTDRFNQALSYAEAAHRTQQRKGSGIPYVAHLLAVCALVLEYGGDEDQAIAALLHDAVEDQGGAERLKDIRAKFGDQVADIVAACSDAFTLPKPPWQERKQQYIDALSKHDPTSWLVSCADKLHNASSILRDYESLGDELWSRF